MCSRMKHMQFGKSEVSVGVAKLKYVRFPHPDLGTCNRADIAIMGSSQADHLRYFDLVDSSLQRPPGWYG